jgi:hypothetical protein
MGVYKSSKTMNSGELFFTNIYSLGFLLLERAERILFLEEMVYWVH